MPALLFVPNGVAGAEPGAGAQDPAVQRIPCDGAMDSRWIQWRIGASNTNLVIDVNAQDKRQAIVWPDHVGQNQTWVEETAAEGGFYLHPCYDRWLCLDVEDGRYANSVPLIVFPCNGQANQRFAAVLSGAFDLIYPIEARQCLNVEGGIGQGRRVVLWDCVASDNELWTFSGR